MGLPAALLALMRSRRMRAMRSTMSFSRVPLGPMAPGSSPPWPGSSAMMMSLSLLGARVRMPVAAGVSGASGAAADAVLPKGGRLVLLVPAAPVLLPVLVLLGRRLVLAGVWRLAMRSPKGSALLVSGLVAGVRMPVVACGRAALAVLLAGLRCCASHSPKGSLLVVPVLAGALMPGLPSVACAVAAAWFSRLRWRMSCSSGSGAVAG